jgi:hypothetical protein
MQRYCPFALTRVFWMAPETRVFLLLARLPCLDFKKAFRF